MDLTGAFSKLTPNLGRAISIYRVIRVRPAIGPRRSVVAPLAAPRLTEAMLADAEHRYEDGEVLRVIAGDLNVSRQRLAKALRSRGVRLRGEKPSSDQLREMCRRYEQGASLAEIGALVGFNPSSVRVNLLRMGVRMRDTHGRSK